MMVKIFVFGGDESFFHNSRNLFFRHKQAFFCGVFHHQLSVTGIKTGRHRRFIFGKLPKVRKLLRNLPERRQNEHQTNDRKKEKRAEQRRKRFEHH